jgi:hypothetical protein
MKVFTRTLAVEVRFTFTWEMSQHDLETEPETGTDLPVLSRDCIKQIQLVKSVFFINQLDMQRTHSHGYDSEII